MEKPGVAIPGQSSIMSGTERPSESLIPAMQIADHLQEILLRTHAALNSTDAWATAQLDFWAEQHRRAISVSLASRAS